MTKDSRIQRISLFSFGALVLAIICRTDLYCFAQPQPHSEQSPSISSPRIIIKFKSDSPLASEAPTRFEQKVSFHDSYLDQLNQKYKLKKIEYLSPGPDVNQVREKFKKRTHRIASGDRLPDWPRIYIFEFTDPIDPAMVASLYAKSQQVEYAQPDYAVKNYQYPQFENENNLKDDSYF